MKASANGKANTAWAQWKGEALTRLDLKLPYGDLLTGKQSGEWLECRDPRSLSGDKNPSAGVADGSGTWQRGTFRSFRDEESMTLIDFLLQVRCVPTVKEAQQKIADWSGVPMPKGKPPNSGTARSAASSTAASGTANETKATTFGSGFKVDWIDSALFARTDYRPRMLVQNLFVANQPGCLGGPRKNLKTSIVVDLGVSLGSATPFLSRFKVYRKVRTVIISGESGEYTLQETANRICAARGIALSSVDVLWGFRLPQMANPADMAALHNGLKQHQVEVCVVDPLYLAMLAGQTEIKAENLFHTGPLLQAATQACLSAGATPLFIHHSKKNLAHPSYEPLELEDLAFAGIQEFSRQWLLLSRRDPYDPDAKGSHRLWMVAGGSVGHGGLWAVDVEEGVIEEDESGLIVGGRKWEVTVSSASEARQDQAEKTDTKKQQKQDRQDKADDGAILAALDRLTEAAVTPVNVPQRGKRKKRAAAEMEMPAMRLSEVITHSKLPKERGKRAILRLLEEAIIAESPAIVMSGKNNKARHEYPGIRRKKNNDSNDSTKSHSESHSSHSANE